MRCHLRVGSPGLGQGAKMLVLLIVEVLLLGLASASSASDAGEIFMGSFIGGANRIANATLVSLGFDRRNI